MNIERSLRNAALLFLILALVVGAANAFYVANIVSVHRSSGIAAKCTVYSGKADPTDFGITDPSSFLDTLYVKVFYHFIPDKADIFYQQQGACTDGDHIWAGWSSPLELLLVSPLSFEAYSRSFSDSDWVFGHANDFTYNPDTNRLYVCSYHEDDFGYSGNIAVVNPETLLVESIIKLQRENKMCPVHGIAYDRIHRQYITATRDSSGCGYAVFNENFEYLYTIMTERQESYVLQGIETDGSFIYRALCNPAGKNYVAVYGYDGTLIKLITVPVSGGALELEDIFYDWRGNWYLNFSDHESPVGGCALAYAGLQVNVDYNQIEQFYDLWRKVLFKNS